MNFLINYLSLSAAAGLSCFAADTPPAAAGKTETAPATTVTTAPNRLAKEKSPYLLQHAHNPVNWYPWGEEAFDKAKKENKPILLSIGYSTCHWCHVMERESFESPEVAAVLNDKFIAIKLDREERPDVDQIYMTAMQALQLGGGWPLNAFLTPERKPFYGGTYFPKDKFIVVLKRVDELWNTNRDELTSDAHNLSAELGKAMAGEAPKAAAMPGREVAMETAKGFAAQYDPKFGGFGKSPKFPQPYIPGLLLLTGSDAGDKAMIDKVLFTCRRMAAGGIYDALGGGFSRYSVDEKWLVPHFEKMLYDNAQLLELYLDAGLVSGDAQYHATALDTIRYVLRDMSHRDGGFYSAEDADSEGHEGKFYCWTKQELLDALGPEDGAWACAWFGVTEKGNFVDHSHPQPIPNQNVLSTVEPEKATGKEVAARLAAVRAKLLALRAGRVRPHLDDKILTSWNGLMLGAMARAGRILGDAPALTAAKRNFDFIRSTMWEPGTKILHHRWRDGERDQAVLLSTFAYYLSGSIGLYEATLDPAVLEFCVAVAEGMLTHFYDAKAGGFYTSGSGKDLIFRAKDDYDGAEPSGNSVAVYSLLRLAAITDNKSFRDAAEKTLLFHSARLKEMPQGMPLMVQALAWFQREPFRVVITGDVASPQAQALLKAAHSIYQPHRVILGTSGPVEPFARTLTAGKNGPEANVCTGKECRLPTNDPAQVIKNLTGK